jgi:hypothetical protein
LRTVIEGSAVLAQLPYAQARPCAAANCLDLLSRDMASSIAEAGGENLMLRRSLAPYLLGVRFLTRGAGLDGSGRLPLVDLDHVALDPPRSTEQILHPAKYWDSALRDDPRELQVPDVSPQLGAGWSLASSDTLGELQLAALVGLALPQAPALVDLAATGWLAPATAGWDGDLWQLYRRGDEAVVVLVSVWDSAQDALEFSQAVSQGRDWTVRVDDETVALVADGRSASGGPRPADVIQAALEGLRTR